MIRALVLFLVVSGLVSICSGQGKTKSANYTFPEPDSEFVVSFPEKPVVKTLFSDAGSSLQAELYLGNLSFLRAESQRMTDAVIKRLHEADDSELAKVPLDYAANIALKNPTVVVTRTEFGRCAKLRGYAKVNDTAIYYEVYFYVGKTDVIGLYVAAPSGQYPTPAILRFLNSLRRK